MARPPFARRSEIAGWLLAGGEARRMGGVDKGLIAVGGRSVIARIIEKLEPQTGALAVNANGDARRFAPFGLPVVPDSVGTQAGPLAGLLTGLAWAGAQGHAWLLSVPTDTPFLPGDLAMRLMAAAEESEAAIAASGGRSHYVIGLWRVRLAERLAKALEAEALRKAEDWAARIRPAVVEWASEPFDPFHNINRPADLAAARRIAEELCP